MARVSQGKDAAAQDAASKMLTTSTGTGVAWDTGAIAPREGGRGSHRGGSDGRPERAGGS
jgi:hypothetical protein